MCLVLIDWQPKKDNWLNLVSNRDEFFDRPTLPLQSWKQTPNLYAGIDVEHHGSWLGVNKDKGRFAILTNVRTKGAVKNGKSRGKLVKHVLLVEQSIEEFVQKSKLSDYSSFNLLVGNKNQLFYITNYPEVTVKSLNPGIYTLSNASINTPWPKTQDAKKDYENWQINKKEELVYLLNNSNTYPKEMLPDTGISKDLEEKLSAQFINLEHYGTRSSHSIVAHKNKIKIREIQWDRHKNSISDIQFNLNIPTNCFN